MVTMSFDFDARIATVDAPFTTITCQEIVNLVRAQEFTFKGLRSDIIIETEGKQPLPGGIFKAITVTFINNWKLAFEADAGPDFKLRTVTQGDLLAKDFAGNLVYPISPTAFISVSLAQTTSSGLIDNRNFRSLLDETTVSVGSTATVVRTALTQPDDWWRGAYAVFTGAAGKQARIIKGYKQTNGELTLDEALSFTPAAGDAVDIVVGGFGGIDRRRVNLIPGLF